MLPKVHLLVNIGHLKDKSKRRAEPEMDNLQRGHLMLVGCQDVKL